MFLRLACCMCVGLCVQIVVGHQIRHADGFVMIGHNSQCMWTVNVGFQKSQMSTGWQEFGCAMKERSALA